MPVRISMFYFFNTKPLKMLSHKQYQEWHRLIKTGTMIKYKS